MHATQQTVVQCHDKKTVSGMRNGIVDIMDWHMQRSENCLWRRVPTWTVILIGTECKATVTGASIAAGLVKAHLLTAVTSGRAFINVCMQSATLNLWQADNMHILSSTTCDNSIYNNDPHQARTQTAQPKIQPGWMFSYSEIYSANGVFTILQYSDAKKRFSTGDNGRLTLFITAKNWIEVDLVEYINIY